MKPDSNRPITLEDLLRLKRAERPPAEFWSEFDRSLRAKQLAALVEKRPWWQTLPHALGRLSRYRIALGASAAVVITVFSVRSYQTATPAAVEEPAAPASVAVAAAAPGEADVPATTGAPARVVQPDSSAVAVAATPVEASPPLVAVSESATPAELSRVISLGGASALEPEPAAQSPSARYIAANLAAVQAAEPVVTRSLLSGATGFESRAMPARPTVEPLHQMTPPSESRRARLLTAMVSAASYESPARTTERVANRIPEERLYDQISRIGARGDRVNLKF